MGRPTFLSGLASIYDLYNVRRIIVDLEGINDNDGLKTDFGLVGYDLDCAIIDYNQMNQDTKLKHEEKQAEVSTKG